MEIYIGSTHDEIQREQEHKSNWNNENYPGYNRKVYVFIRDNGGWDNWIYKVIQEFPCENELQLRIRERDHYDLLNPALNSQRPYISEEERKKYNKIYEANYRENHRDEIKKYQTDYREKNKKQINHTCDCGGKYTHQHKSHHLDTNKHKKFIKNKNNN